ncbi:2-(1,2-epoxy-1,2-dihydrophenyl)acetyl-CoA isomerase [Tamaricihabitans halophyticus]|uniref:2-(1,2-epoxy-1,2-dihydrophenyl)acetyl-CoA isomerase n=1 Tax=Tamaricihabitans halophyticus TaxID=1262583 RepID=A0A4R2R3F1_9PSEU|nr:2-(1,2-epoxy-1,2-dihydrophenyl)acetyl-CoA isomerase [Tamaricihabitans halophyticus]
MSDCLVVEDNAGVRTLTMHRPEAYNSLTVELKEALRDALADTAADAAIRAVVLTGSGKAFCAGQDLKEHIGLLNAGDPAPFETVRRHYSPIVQTLARMDKPVIAAVNGTAAGAGAAFAYAADLRIAAESAKFLMAFANVGLGPDSGASWTLQRLVGFGKAMELMLLAKPVDAAAAAELGLVNQVVADEEVLGTAQELAARLAAGPTAAYAKIKQTLHGAADAELDEALELEAQAQAALGRTADHAEAVDAFVAKRAAQFTGS